MWLLDVRRTRLQHFNDNELPQYAILSHTWGNEEVSFQEITNQALCTSSKAGFTKILNACKVALRDHSLDWIWIDTCCIDKSSSAELSEAINSMYRYYRDSAICYAYLEDVATPKHFDECGNSRWWTRGWTLQELIAPKLVNFYASDWTWFGTRNDSAILISMGTGIPVEVLEGRDPRDYYISQRFSWAAARQTTRPEDMAYCLLGLLDVNMPLLYGEGSKAFIRLQEELIRVSDDDSIFGWTIPRDLLNPNSYVSGVLADSPSSFADCADLRPFSLAMPSYQLTNQGLSIDLKLHEVRTKSGVIYATMIMEDATGRQPPYVYLEHLYSNRYVRVGYTGPWKSTRTKEERIIIQQRNPTLCYKDPGTAAGMIFRIGRKGDWTPKHVHVFCGHVHEHSNAEEHFRIDIAQSQSNAHGDSILAPFHEDLKLDGKPWIVMAVDARNAFYEGPTAHVLIFEFGIRYEPELADIAADHKSTIWFRWSVRTRAEALADGLEYRAAEQVKWRSIATFKQQNHVAPGSDYGARVPPGVVKSLQPDSQWLYLDYVANPSRSTADNNNYLSLRCHAEMLGHHFYLVSDIRYTESRSHNLPISHFDNDRAIFTRLSPESEVRKGKDIESWSQRDFRKARKKSKRRQSWTRADLTFGRQSYKT